MGEAFYGSQIQKESPTVQGELIKAICTLTKNKDTKVTMSGRTDRHVSAKHQVAHFDSNKIEDEKKFLISLNSILPDGIRVFEIESIVASFHAQKQATYRHYQYKINNSLFKASVFDKNVFHTRLKLNLDRMQEAINHLVGEHDFSSFKSVSDNPSKICNIYLAKITQDSEYILIDIIGNRFLYNMIRTIVGQLLLIERNNLNPSTMDEVLKSKDRTKAAQVAKAEGLTLMYVGYDNVETYINEFTKGR